MLAFGASITSRRWPCSRVSERTMAMGSSLARGRMCTRLNRLREEFVPAIPACEPLPQFDEIDLATPDRPFVEGSKPGLRFRHHVQRQPAAVRLAVPLPVLELLLAQALDRLVQTVGKGVEQLRRPALDRLVETAQIDRRARHSRLGA